MRMKRRSGVSAFVPLAFVVFVLLGAPAWGGEAILLTDAELDQVYGGEIEQEANGNNNVQTASMCGTCTLNVTDSAQAGASAMIIVNAVAANVNAQVNMVVTDGSTIGTINQLDVGFTSTGGGNITN